MPLLGDGQIFERYRIIRWLGSGSTGESYEAEDQMLLRKVTLKLIHPWTTLPDSARRQFFREMQGISSLNHPYLAAVLDYGGSDGRLYVARRYISSGSLLGTDGRLWYRPPLTIADAFTYAHQLAHVLQYVHQHGYLHASLTFTNVLVLRGPNLEQEADYAPFLVADIGLANFVRRFGTPQVEALPVSAAPEQLGKRVAPASDQFALAVLLYFWLTGRPPYLGTPAEVEKLKLTETITPLSTLNPSLTPEQDRIILRALAVYPEKRYPSVLAFTEALKETQPARPEAFASPIPTQAEMPHTLFQSTTNELPTSEQPTEARAKLPASSHQTSGAQSDESHHSALEELLTHPHIAHPESKRGFSSAQTTEQEPATLPTLPETPRPEEEIVQFDFTSSPIISEKPAALAEEVPTAQSLPETAAEPSIQHETSPETTPGPISNEQPLPPVEATSVEAELPAASEEPAPSGRAGQASADTSSTDAPSALPKTRAAYTRPGGDLPRLIVFSPYTNSTYEYPLTRAEINIGRAGASDLHLEQDDLTSRHHALLKCEGERVLIFDKRSFNGVFINGQQIEVGHGYELTDGDHIGIGNYELIFRSALGSSVSQAG
ncbi:MAG TPA: FHA domain-containing protein [Ktedonobacterales bacterium]|nr:FHA domain-containing protein [Ktedonobacterales bacterium]